jgi:hypothetical protein
LRASGQQEPEKDNDKYVTKQGEIVGLGPRTFPFLMTNMWGEGKVVEIVGYMFRDEVRLFRV